MRTRPYRDVTRAKCARCGGRASHEWSGVCAERTKKGKGPVIYHALCHRCDVILNWISMTYVYGAKRAKEIMRGYE